jgi:hypothetical protein
MVAPALAVALLSAAVVFSASLVAAKRFAATGARPYGPLSLAALALCVLFLAGVVGDYFRPVEGYVLSGAAFLAAAVLLVGRSRNA